MTAVEDLTEIASHAAQAECTVRSVKWADRAAIEKSIVAVVRTLDLERESLRHPGVSAVHTSPFWTARLGRLAGPNPILEPATALLQAGVINGAAETPADGAIDPSAQDAAGSFAGILRPDRPLPDPPVQVGAHLPAAAVSGSAADAARAEADAVAAVTVARIAFSEAYLAALRARLAVLDAGDTEATAAAMRGYQVYTQGNPLLRHLRALARGTREELVHIFADKPRDVAFRLGISLGLGLAYLGFLHFYQWDDKQQYLPYLALFALSSVTGSVVCTNALSVDAGRVRAALAGGTRLWHVLITKNLSIFCLVGAAGMLLSLLLTFRTRDGVAYVKACGLLFTMILLWLGVGNVLSVVSPLRAEPLKERRKDGTLKPFLLSFIVSYGVGLIVNLMLYWRIWAKQTMLEQYEGPWVPVILVVLSATVSWILLTVLAIALAEQPRFRRALMREMVDYRNRQSDL